MFGLQSMISVPSTGPYSLNCKKEEFVHAKIDLINLHLFSSKPLEFDLTPQFLQYSTYYLGESVQTFINVSKFLFLTVP